MNGLIFTPTPKSNVHAWTQLGNPGWEWPSFSQSLGKVYSLAGRPNNGPLQLSFPDNSDNEWPQVWKDTLAGLDIPVTGDLLTGEANGLIVNPETVDPETKTRSHAGSVYLGPALSRGNLTVVTEATVEKILFDKSNPAEVLAEGVQYTKAGETKVVRARKEVVLAAGAINSPKVLELSGIGDAGLLEKLGIDVVINNPNVGENLQDHVMCILSFEAKDGIKTLDPVARQEPEAVAAAQEAYARLTGPLATSGTSNTAQLPFPGIETDEGKRELDRLLDTLLNTKVDEDKPALLAAEANKNFVRSILASPEEASGCYITLPGYVGFDAAGAMVPPPPGKEGYFSIALLTTHPLSRGSTHIKSASAAVQDVDLDPHYFSHPLDLEIFARHLRHLETVLVASSPLSDRLKPGGKRNPEAPSPGGFSDLDKAREYARSTAMDAHHFVGTCSMMLPELGGVVDPQLRVYGTKNLRVCDASIISSDPAS